MFNPLDMLQAQNGAGMQILAQQFGLTPEQVRSATEALMPAFALGIQRSPAADPTGLAQLFGLPGARPTGPADTMLGQMFGSPALTQAILQQASATSGVGSQVLRQMLPAIAGAVVASLVHMLLQQAPEPARAPTPAPFPVNPVWAEVMRAFLPADAPRAAKPERAPNAKPSPKTADPGAGGDVLGQMLRTGAEVQEQNVKVMQNLFEAFWAEADAGRPAQMPPGAASRDGSNRPRKGRGRADES